MGKICLYGAIKKETSDYLPIDIYHPYFYNDSVFRKEYGLDLREKTAEAVVLKRSSVFLDERSQKFPAHS